MYAIDEIKAISSTAGCVRGCDLKSYWKFAQEAKSGPHTYKRIESRIGYD